MKELIKKFGFEGLEEVCKEQGWKIPTKEEFINSGFKTSYDYIWVSDEASFPFLGYQLNTNTLELIEVHKHFMEHCVVIKENK